jgi:hypothetical protein
LYQIQIQPLDRTITSLSSSKNISLQTDSQNV